ncbi:MAG: hypothetical protein ACQERK_06545 [Campylobacterota bacterium]
MDINSMGQMAQSQMQMQSQQGRQSGIDQMREEVVQAMPKNQQEQISQGLQSMQPNEVREVRQEVQQMQEGKKSQEDQAQKVQEMIDPQNSPAPSFNGGAPVYA